MSDIERLAHASTELANHVAAVIRLSNVLTGLLKDGAREDLDPETRRVLLGAAGLEHSQFRAEHFRGLISTMNTVVEITDRLYQAEPVPSEAPLPPAIPAEDAPVVQLADTQEEPDAAPAP